MPSLIAFGLTRMRFYDQARRPEAGHDVKPGFARAPLIQRLPRLLTRLQSAAATSFSRAALQGVQTHTNSWHRAPRDFIDP